MAERSFLESLESCMRHQPTEFVLGGGLGQERHEEHPAIRDPDSSADEQVPNLVVWTGKTHHRMLAVKVG